MVCGVGQKDWGQKDSCPESFCRNSVRNAGFAWVFSRSVSIFDRLISLAGHVAAWFFQDGNERDAGVHS